MSSVGRLQTDRTASLGLGVMSAGKLASMDSVMRQNVLNRTATFGPPRGFPAGTAPHSLVSVGASGATRYRINPAGALLRNNGHSPTMPAPNGRTHDLFVGEFGRLDRDRINIAAARVRRFHAQHAIEVMNTHNDQELLVRREAEKKTRHLPLRKLVARAPEVLTALCPCWMASPLSVSQLLEGDRAYFDVVVV